MTPQEIRERAALAGAVIEAMLWAVFRFALSMLALYLLVWVAFLVFMLVT